MSETDDNLSDRLIDDQPDNDATVDHAHLRTVIVSKGDLLGSLGIATTAQGTRVASIDPRRPRPSVRVYDDGQVAHREFARGLAITLSRGWKILYDGPPLRG